MRNGFWLAEPMNCGMFGFLSACAASGEPPTATIGKFVRLACAAASSVPKPMASLTANAPSTSEPIQELVESDESDVMRSSASDSNRSARCGSLNTVVLPIDRGLRYPSDLTDAEWALVEPMIPPAKRGGRRREVNVREVLNAVFYVLSTGCQWQALPKDLPPKSTAHCYFMLWDWDGTLERLHHTLYVATREQEGREASPTAAIIDSQSAKAAQKGALRSTRKALMRARKSRAASGISLSTRSAFSSTSFIPPMCKIATAPELVSIGAPDVYSPSSNASSPMLAIKEPRRPQPSQDR